MTILFDDTFTGTGTLADHVSDSGHGWVDPSVFSSTNLGRIEGGMLAAVSADTGPGSVNMEADVAGLALLQEDGLAFSVDVDFAELPAVWGLELDVNDSIESAAYMYCGVQRDSTGATYFSGGTSLSSGLVDDFAIVDVGTPSTIHLRWEFTAGEVRCYWNGLLATIADAPPPGVDGFLSMTFRAECANPSTFPGFVSRLTVEASPWTSQVMGFAPVRFGTPALPLVPMSVSGFAPVQFGTPTCPAPTPPTVSGFAPVQFGTPYVVLVTGALATTFGTPLLLPQTPLVFAWRAVQFGFTTLPTDLTFAVQGVDQVCFGYPVNVRYLALTNRQLMLQRGWLAAHFGAPPPPVFDPGGCAC